MSSCDQVLSRETVAKHTAEFVGTFILVFTIGCNQLSGADSAFAPLSIACALMVSIYALGGVSGANFNPSVSLALGLCGKKAWGEVASYSVVQILAGILAGLSYSYMFGDGFKLAPAEKSTALQMGAVETIYTAMLCFVVLNCVASRKNNPDADANQFFGLAIGFVVVAGAYSAGPISGGCFNPAVSFGIDVSSSEKEIVWCWAYLFFQVMGSIVASVLFQAVRAQEFWNDLQEAPLLWQKLCSEFLGTFMLVLTVTLCIIATSPATALAAGACLMCMVYALGNVSGAHFNPAVTLGMMLRGACGIADGFAYMLVQLIAGALASCLASGVHHGVQLGPLKPDAEWHTIAAAEILFTFVLVFVVLSLATAQVASLTLHKNLLGFAVGMCIVVGGFAIGKVSGGSLNPAVSVGIAVKATDPFVNCLGYCAFELLGGALAFVVFYLTHPREFGEEILMIGK